MTRHTDLIENTMQLRDNVIDLSGQVACVDGHLAVRESSMWQGTRVIDSGFRIWREKNSVCVWVWV